MSNTYCLCFNMILSGLKIKLNNIKFYTHNEIYKFELKISIRKKLCLFTYILYLLNYIYSVTV